MPLESGKSKSAFSHNISTEMHAGKPLKQSLAIAYSMKRKAQKRMAMGGYAEGGPCESHGLDMCPECHKHEMSESKHHAGQYAHGGEVEDHDMVTEIMNKHRDAGAIANDTGEGTFADLEPNEFDDLVKDGPEQVEGYTGANSGDEIGDEAEDEEQSDMVSQIMRSRRKKDRMPRPA